MKKIWLNLKPLKRVSVIVQVVGEIIYQNTKNKPHHPVVLFSFLFLQPTPVTPTRLNVISTKKKLSEICIRIQFS